LRLTNNVHHDNEARKGEKMEEYHCKKCGHTWYTRTEKAPVACPNCNSRIHHGPVKDERKMPKE